MPLSLGSSNPRRVVVQEDCVRFIGAGDKRGETIGFMVVCLNIGQGLCTAWDICSKSQRLRVKVMVPVNDLEMGGWLSWGLLLLLTL